MARTNALGGRPTDPPTYMRSVLYTGAAWSEGAWRHSLRALVPCFGAPLLRHFGGLLLSICSKLSKYIFAGATAFACCVLLAACGYSVLRPGGRCGIGYCTYSGVFSCPLALAHAVLGSVRPRRVALWPWSRSAYPCPLVSNAPSPRGLRPTCGNMPGAMARACAALGRVRGRCLCWRRLRSRSLRWGSWRPAAACAARVLAAAASPALAFACAVFLVTCVFGDAAVDGGGEGGCRSCQEGNRRQICPLAHPPPAHAHGVGVCGPLRCLCFRRPRRGG
jgi:hypothetical protein